MKKPGERIVMTLACRDAWLRNRYILLLDGDGCEYYSLLVSTESGGRFSAEFVKNVSRDAEIAKELVRTLCGNKVSASGLLYVLQDMYIV